MNNNNKEEEEEETEYKEVVLVESTTTTTTRTSSSRRRLVVSMIPTTKRPHHNGKARVSWIPKSFDYGDNTGRIPLPTFDRYNNSNVALLPTIVAVVLLVLVRKLHRENNNKNNDDDDDDGDLKDFLRGNVYYKIGVRIFKIIWNKWNRRKSKKDIPWGTMVGERRQRPVVVIVLVEQQWRILRMVLPLLLWVVLWRRRMQLSSIESLWCHKAQQTKQQYPQLSKQQQQQHPSHRRNQPNPENPSSPTHRFPINES